MSPQPNHTRSLATMLEHWTHRRPDTLGIEVDGVEARTYQQWRERSGRVARGFAAISSGPATGTGFGFAGKSAVLWGEVLLGASMVRGFGAPLNWRLSRPEMDDLVAGAGLAAIVVEAEFLPLFGYEDPGDGRPRIVIGNDAPIDYDDWCAAWPHDPVALNPEPEDIALVIYTSGTSGRPKGVELSNRSIAANLATDAPWDIVAGDVVMVPAPNFHVSGTGWVFYCLGLGASSLHVLDVRPADVLATLASGQVNHALTVPAVVQMLVQHADARKATYPALRTLIYGGSPMSPTTATAAQEVFGCDLVQSYGMTETCGPITFLGPTDHRRRGERLASAGRLVDGVEMGVFDPATGERCETGTTGEVWTRSDLLFSGYRGQPDEFRAVVTPEGWFRTGDAGFMDAEGYLFLCDRIKDMVVSGGENIYPIEVENVLMSHSAVTDAAVVGVPHEKWGETVKAVVVTLSAEVTEADLISFCRDRIAHYKCPTSVDFVADLPRNPSGKVLKRQLRARYWDGMARGIS